MHPEEFRLKHNLSRTEAAYHLGISEYEMKAYSFRESARGHRNPSVAVKKLCELLDKNWQNQLKTS